MLDSDYTSWALLMHCAEKSKSPRYLSSFIMSREESLGVNVISYLREKLPKYVRLGLKYFSLKIYIQINRLYDFSFFKLKCNFFYNERLTVNRTVS